MVTSAHPWKLVAPWYRWSHAALPSDGRESRPVFQKFAGANFVDDFREAPQHSLVFEPSTDVVTGFDRVAAKVTGGTIAGKVASLFPVDADGKYLPRNKWGSVTPYRSRLAPTDLRKLYLPIHDRHYLVVSELHCDVPGFPTVPRRGVCQAGFVVRRRRSIVPKGKEATVVAEVAKVTRAEADLGDLLALVEEGQRSTLTADARKALEDRKAELAKDAGETDFVALVSNATVRVEDKRQALADFYTKEGIVTRVDGWFPRTVNGAPSRTSGFWRELSQAEQDGDPHAGVPGPSKGDARIIEEVYRLYPLVPDPRDTKHDAAGRTIYYGVVPTATSMHDDAGAPAFDSETTLEVRCFVRRHHECPPRRGKTPDCHGEIAWAKPTEPYRVAAPFDVIGAAQRPITIQMPDLAELAAQVGRRPRGSLSPVRVVQPQHMSPVPKDGVPGGEMSGPAICFFSIPLITIIAMFVLNLFLPIVVFVFQLWFLLVLRFCIKPQISIGGGVDAALSAKPPGIDFDASASISIGGNTYSTKGLHNTLKADVLAQVLTELGELTDHVDAGVDALSNTALANLEQNNNDNASLPDDPEKPPPEVTYSAHLVYEPHRDPEWRPSGGRG